MARMHERRLAELERGTPTGMVRGIIVKKNFGEDEQEAIQKAYGDDTPRPNDLLVVITFVSPEDIQNERNQTTA